MQKGCHWKVLNDFWMQSVINPLKKMSVKRTTQWGGYKKYFITLILESLIWIQNLSCPVLVTKVTRSASDETDFTERNQINHKRKDQKIEKTVLVTITWHETLRKSSLGLIEISRMLHHGIHILNNEEANRIKRTRWSRDDLLSSKRRRKAL